MADVGSLGAELATLEQRLDAVQYRQRELMLAMPNLPHPSVPVGQSEADNVELRRWGTPRTFGFAPRDHVDLGVALGRAGFRNLVPNSPGRASIR